MTTLFVGHKAQKLKNKKHSMYSQEYLTQLKHLHAAKDRPRGFGGKIKDLGEFYNFFKSWNVKTAAANGNDPNNGNSAPGNKSNLIVTK